MVEIKGIKLNSPYVLAPLAGITDAPFRTLAREMGASLTYSEMVSGKGLWFKDRNTKDLLYTYPDEDMVAFQVFGSEPEIMAYTARTLEEYPNKILDFNIGCPVPKVVRNGEGSALMRDPELIYTLVKAMVDNTSKPVTAKIRLGWDENTINAVDCAKAVESAGGAAICVHGRTREQFYQGKANWQEIGKVKRAVDIPVIGNGDVASIEDAKEMFEVTGCDLIMVGRAALGNPWIFKELVTGTKVNPTIDEKKEMIIRHLNMVVDLKGEYVGIRQMRKHVGWYIKGMHGSAKLRGRINEIEDMESLIKAIEEI
ncbi:MAG: tRNA dihydrouridine synthase DusB [Clostridia bacterium]|nr:tRNA dihydrouridine synthase DusB [Clostridia bacterium]